MFVLTAMPCCEDVLRWADVYTLDNPSCQDYENVAAPLTDGMVCAGDNGGFTEKDVCQVKTIPTRHTTLLRR